MTRFRSAFAVPSGFCVAARAETVATAGTTTQDTNTRLSKKSAASGHRRPQSKAAAEQAA